MQQRGANTTMENEEGEQLTQPPPRSRHNSKLKVLVRSHAMREETSPPREPTPNHVVSPCIKLTPSPEITSPVCTSPCTHPTVVLSPSISRGNSPCRSPVCISPTSTLVPSPISRCSSQSASSHHNLDNLERLQPSDAAAIDDGVAAADSPAKYLNKLNRQNLEKDCKQTSHVINNNNKKKYICDCQTQNCIKCIKGQERNINNNLTNINNNVLSSPNTLTVTRTSSRGKLRQQSSSQGSFESSSNSPCLSRDSSSEQYTDTTGIDLEQFIPETLNRNAKDRALMLRIEQELVNLAKDRVKTHYKFPPMSSYQRMLVHRCAAYFGMDHNIESSGKCVVVNKTKNTRIPDIEFKEHVKEDIVFSEEPRRSILKRDSSSIEDYNFKSPDRAFSIENRRSKSFEEREEEYEKAKRRIFNREMHEGSSEDFGWSEIPWSSTDSDYSSAKFRLQPPEIHRRHMGKLAKVQSEETSETLRPCVAKSYSFGGYGGGGAVLTRGDSVMSTHSAGARLLTKQDSAASSVSWRLSPSSSGYKSQSQMSESVTPSPTSTPHPIGDSRQDSNGSSDNQDSVTDNRMVFTDIQNVRVGSVIINPQTGKPIKNEDGSLYHYDPHHPPPSFIAQTKPPPSPQKIVPKEKERPVTPRKRSPRISPSRNKSNFKTTATSPSLPYSPPLSIVQHNRSYQYLQNPGENVTNLPQQQFPVYGSAYPPPPAAHEGNVPVYPQPYIVYTAPYGVPVQQSFDGRIEPPPLPEMTNTYFVPDNSAQPPAQTIHTYPQQTTPYWNQQPITFYQNSPQTPNPGTPQRFSVPIPPQGQSGFVSSGYPPNYISQATQPPQSTELVHVYQNQPVQVVYPTQANPPNPVLYPNQPPVIYTQNPVYTSPVYQPQGVPPAYPQNTPTPNSCTSSASNPPYTGPVPEPNPPQNFMHLAQSMQQMSLGPNQQVANIQNHPSFICNKGPPPQHFEIRPKVGMPKGNKFSTPKGFIMGSSQSSTGTNSPAATVVAGYCPQNPGAYRTPPETPPNHFNYQPNYIPPMVFRQMSNVRANTPGTARSSRSPTPASDITLFERQRISLPPNLYHGTPYVLQSDTRMIPGRGQPSAYRQTAPIRQQSFNQGSDNRSHKGRKSKGKQTQVGLPPSGKQI